MVANGPLVSPENGSGQAGWSALAIVRDVITVVLDDRQSGACQQRAGLGIAIGDQHFAITKREHIAPHRPELLLGNVNESPPTIPEQFEKGDCHNWPVDNSYFFGDGTDHRHQMEAFARAVAVGQIKGQNIDTLLTEDGGELANTLEICAVTPADR